MSNDIPSRRKPQNWTRERRARQSALAKAKWAAKPAALRGRLGRLARDIDDEIYEGAMGAIAVAFMSLRMNALLNMPKAKFIELAVAATSHADAEIDAKTAEAVRARLIRDFKRGEE